MIDAIRDCSVCGVAIVEADVRLGLAEICDECSALLCSVCSGAGHDCEVD